MLTPFRSCPLCDFGWRIVERIEYTGKFVKRRKRCECWTKYYLDKVKR